MLNENKLTTLKTAVIGSDETKYRQAKIYSWSTDSNTQQLHPLLEAVLIGDRDLIKLLLGAGSIPRVDEIRVSVSVGEMSVVVDSAKGGGSQRWLYNKLLGVFSERCRATVQGELEQAAQRGIGILSQRVQEAIKAFTTGGGLSGGGNEGAKEEGVAGPEPEPEASFEF